jgi:hypothetical protein
MRVYLLACDLTSCTNARAVRVEGTSPVDNKSQFFFSYRQTGVACSDCCLSTRPSVLAATSPDITVAYLIFFIVALHDYHEDLFMDPSLAAHNINVLPMYSLFFFDD